MAKSNSIPVARPRIGAPLRMMRKARGWTQAEVAAKLGLTRQMLALYESGALIPPIERRVALSQLLATTTDALWPPIGLRPKMRRKARPKSPSSSPPSPPP